MDYNQRLKCKLGGDELYVQVRFGPLSVVVCLSYSIVTIWGGGRLSSINWRWENGVFFVPLHFNNNGLFVLAGPTKSRPEPSGRRPEPYNDRRIKRENARESGCSYDANISKLWAALDHIFILHGMMMLHKLWRIILENCNIPEFWTACLSA